MRFKFPGFVKTHIIVGRNAPIVGAAYVQTSFHPTFIQHSRTTAVVRTSMDAAFDQGISSATVRPYATETNLQAGGRGFESHRLHQTGCAPNPGLEEVGVRSCSATRVDIRVQLIAVTYARRDGEPPPLRMRTTSSFIAAPTVVGE